MFRRIKNFIGHLKGYSGCMCCHDSWDWKRPKYIVCLEREYKTHGKKARVIITEEACFALCKECFDRLPIDMVIYWHERLVDSWKHTSPAEYPDKKVELMKNTLREKIRREKWNCIK